MLSNKVALWPSYKTEQFFSRNIKPEIPLVTVESSQESADILSKIESSREIFSYIGNLTHWIELGGHLEFPKTITFKVGKSKYNLGLGKSNHFSLLTKVEKMLT